MIFYDIHLIIITWQIRKYLQGFFPGGSEDKASACNVGDPGLIPWLERSPGEGNAMYSSTLAWRIPWTEEPGRLQSMGVTKSWTRLSNFNFTSQGFSSLILDLCLLVIIETLWSSPYNCCKKLENLGYL